MIHICFSEQFSDEETECIFVGPSEELAFNVLATRLAWLECSVRYSRDSGEEWMDLGEEEDDA